MKLTLRESALIRSFSGPYFPAFGMNTEIYRVNRHFSRIQTLAVQMQDMNDEGDKEVIFEVLDVTDVFS